MAKRRKLGNPLALTVMVLLAERSMHPYEIAQTLRRRGKEHSVKINFGSLYTVVQNLEKHGYVEVAGVQRQGNRPERTLYGITEAGRVEMLDWLSDLLAVPAAEYPVFETALSLLPVLPPEEVAELMETREAALEIQAAALRGVLGQLGDKLPRLFVVETEYQLHMIDAQLEWIKNFRQELTDATISGIEEWKSFHESGEVPQDWQELDEQEIVLDPERKA
ncbi:MULTISPECIES: PadR family transcriptional regulator [unclassified Streptomyces]|uniref:PadR family transcriptional regulator n=1 Tax=unclassified Streptomyces TaxID=2593676 RepID=UPI002254C7AE|nr:MULTISPECIES: PadR family transcriptional regulator [unclassified Streptomyces]WSP59925.1 PadR family transcriptional regulator [Streptomyces sp. NBC_01241]WSU26659.1 PadR family transcriptional regulator [Streptomyces sp. NBC_01108]MCX4785640.1 PadR family transcriptional regulator [Streptomyces sp. NBC_01221]MCX4798501.1 PadR family transcriptional regulator [Streptomyces sp. NBC_01242]WSJ41255.1 PadR family transcriptional regulator [Streptomyces sp. NBC_01321]